MFTPGIVQQQFKWRPGLLFREGQQGAWYDPSDLSTLFQDSAGTIPVTTDGDPVGLMLDKSGNDNHASQSTPAAKPTYRTDGTLHWLEFDGVDDRFDLNIPLVNKYLLSVAAASTTTNPVSALFSSALAGYLGTRANGTMWGTYVGVERLFGAVSGTPQIVSISNNANNSSPYVDGIAGDPYSDGQDQQYKYLGHFSGTTGSVSPFMGRFYGAILVSEPGNRENVEKYLAAKAGVTL